MASRSIVESSREEKCRNKRRKTSKESSEESDDDSRKESPQKIRRKVKNASDDELNEDHVLNQEVNIDFEGFPIEENDFQGIKMLLQQLFIMLPVNITELTDLLIAQNYLGSILKMTDDDEGTVYGITTLLDLHKNKEKDFVKKLLQSVQEKCKENAKNLADRLQDLLTKKIGLLLSERFINIPMDVSLPMYSSLSAEIEDAKKVDKMDEIDYLLFITKTVKNASADDLSDSACGEASSSRKKLSSKKKNKSSKINKLEDLQFINPEDEILYKESSLAFSYSVTKATGFAVSGGWDVGDNAMNTFRTIMLIEKTKLNQIIKEIEIMLDG